MLAMALVLALGAANVSAQDAANGQKLYLGTVAGSYACSGCHNVNDTTTQQNRDFRAAAGDPGLIDFAINSNPASTLQMRPLYGIGAPFELSASDESDLAAFINSVVSPGGTKTPTARLSVPAGASFGTQTLFVQGAVQTLTLTNVGTATATIFSINDSDPGEFPLIYSTCYGALVANGSCAINVTFSPSAVGARSATLTVSSDGVGSPQTIQLSGVGSGGASGPGTKVVVVEYYHAAFDHYFITSLADEISKLDSGVPNRDWQRTGRTFNGYDPQFPLPADSLGVCRFFNDSFAPKSSHFYALHGLGCEDTIAKFKDWQLESPDLFNMLIPDVDGNCPVNSIPVYRLYNNGMGGAPNHRFVTSLDDRQLMVSKGYVSEGFGALGVGMCSPQ